MRIILTILSLLFWTNFVQSQCRQFTHTSCPGNTCFVINDTALDIKSSTATYAVVTGDCFVYDNTTGTGAGLFYSKSIQPQIVYGGGWQFSKYAAIELLYRYTFTDYLDGYTSKWSKGNDNWFAVCVRFQYKKKLNYLKCYKI